MYHERIGRHGAVALQMPSGIAPCARRRRQGRAAWQAGMAAEATVAQHYRVRGATVLAERLRTPAGEIDLVLEQEGTLVFVEVKCRRRACLPDSPISERQWQRLESAALHYMMLLQNETGSVPSCRFDVAIVGPEGRATIMENARSFDEH